MEFFSLFSSLSDNFLKKRTINNLDNFFMPPTKKRRSTFSLRNFWPPTFFTNSFFEPVLEPEPIKIHSHRQSLSNKEKTSQIYKIEIDPDDSPKPKKTDLNKAGSAKENPVLIGIDIDENAPQTKPLHEILAKRTDLSTSLGTFPDLNINVKVKDLKTLLDENWLSDEIINIYLFILKRQFPNILVVPSWWSLNLQNHGFPGVSHWTITEELQNLLLKDVSHIDSIIFPVNVFNSHWILVVLFPPKKSWILLDSTGGKLGDVTKTKFFKCMKEWLKNIIKQPWEFSFPLTKNNAHQVLEVDRSNCGVYCCYYAEEICMNNYKTVIKQQSSKQEMDQYRLKILDTLVSQIPLNVTK